LKIDLPVEQEKLTIRARGHLADNPAGGKTFVVFEILEENSRYPFESICVTRRERQKSSGENIAKISADETASSGKITRTSPSSRQSQKKLKSASASIFNPNAMFIVVTNKHIEADPDKEKEHLIVGEDLSAQRTKGSTQKVSNVMIEPEEEETPSGYEMPLEEFVRMAMELQGKKGVTDWSCSEETVWQKLRWKTTRLTLKESYDRTEANRRRYAQVTFQYKGKQVCLVEIDQRGLPNGCSTFVLLSGRHDAALAAKVVKWYVESVTHEKVETRLARSGVSFRIKHHPPGNTASDRSNWLSRLIKILE